MDAPTDLFLHEDLSKPENRINVSLFGLLAFAPFRTWLLSRLSLPAHAAAYPTTNIVDEHGSKRPDFVVRHGETSEVLAWIEVECGRDEAQLARFRAQLPQPVLALWGRVGAPADLSLEEVRAFLDTLDLASEHPQLRANVAHLHGLITEGLEGPSATAYKPAPVSATTLETPFVRALCAALGDRLSLDPHGALRPGGIVARTLSDRGFSLRVYTRRAAGRSVSVLSQTAGRPEIEFPSAEKLARYLPGTEAAIARLAALVTAMGGDITTLTGESRTSVPLTAAERHASEIAAVVLALAGERS